MRVIEIGCKFCEWIAKFGNGVRALRMKCEIVEMGCQSEETDIIFEVRNNVSTSSNYDPLNVGTFALFVYCLSLYGI